MLTTDYGRITCLSSHVLNETPKAKFLCFITFHANPILCSPCQSQLQLQGQTLKALRPLLLLLSTPLSYAVSFYLKDNFKPSYISQMLMDLFNIIRIGSQWSLIFMYHNTFSPLLSTLYSTLFLLYSTLSPCCNTLLYSVHSCWGY